MTCSQRLWHCRQSGFNFSWSEEQKAELLLLLRAAAFTHSSSVRVTLPPRLLGVTAGGPRSFQVCFPAHDVHDHARSQQTGHPAPDRWALALTHTAPSVSRRVYFRAYVFQDPHNSLTTKSTTSSINRHRGQGKEGKVCVPVGVGCLQCCWKWWPCVEARLWHVFIHSAVPPPTRPVSPPSASLHPGSSSALRSTTARPQPARPTVSWMRASAPHTSRTSDSCTVVRLGLWYSSGSPPSPPGPHPCSCSCTDSRAERFSLTDHLDPHTEGPSAAGCQEDEQT